MGLLSNLPKDIATYRTSRSLLLSTGLLVAACVAALAFPVPFGHYLSWARLLGMVVEELFTLSVVCVITVAALSPAAVYRNKPEFLDLVQHASVMALWLAPFVLFFHESSLWMLPIAALLTFIVITSTESNSAPDGASDSLLISLRADLIPLGARFRLQKSVLAAMLLQIGTLAALGGHTVIGTLLVVLSFAVWARDYQCMRANTTELSQPNPGLTLLFASILMIVGLFPFLRHGVGYGSPTAHHGLLPHRPSGGSSTRLQSYAAAHIEDGAATAEGDQGIILWGEKRNYTKLVAPTPVVMKALNSHGNVNPLVIPFDGVYWFFKSPDAQPPPGSRQAHTSPDIVEIRSTDHRPLLIEAHDHLDNLIDLNCCSRVQVVIRNADPYPETVSLELVLVNTTLPHNPSVSLGRLMVNSTGRWNLYEKPGTVDETLNFPIPAHRSLLAFDEVKIVFLLDRARADAAARIAIDHFVLVPRGL